MKYALPPGAPETPMLERALSNDAMRDAFQRYLPPRDSGRWGRCEIEQLSYRPGRSSRILYRMWKEGVETQTEDPRYFYVEFLPASRSLQRYLDLKAREPQRSPTGFVAELDMVYWQFPSDPRLVQLPGVWREGTWSVVSYTPTMSCVLSGVYEDEPTIVKLYHDDRVLRVGRVMEALRTAGVAAPRVLHVDEPRWLLVLEHVPGVPFWSRPADHLVRETMVAMARELVTLHSARLTESTRGLVHRVPHHEQEWRRFGVACRELGAAFPDLVDRLERLRRMLETATIGTKTSLLHGDFHAGQFLIEKGNPHLIDYDNVCLGDPMYDLARFASHLFYKGPLHGRSLPEVEAAVSDFRAAYIAQGTSFHAPSWFWHLAVSLVAKRAHRVLTRLESGASESVRQLVGIAEQNAASIV